VSHLQLRQTLRVGPVERTMLIPLWARAQESRKRRPLVQDLRSLQICESIDYDFGTFRRAYGTQIGCVLRGLLYDQWVGEFLTRHPSGTIVELGAGLSTRFERLDNGTARWVDVDLPDAMALRRRHFSASARRTFLSASVLDAAWPTLVRGAAAGPYTFVCEGMLMYLAPDDVRSLFVRLADHFGPTELAFDSIAPMVVRHQTLHDSMKHMMDAPFRWGIDDVRGVEAWDRRLTVRDVATLPEVARRFRARVGLPHRVVGALVERMLPAFAGAYRLARVELGA
jgi:O-methyltransferase involved in polyketide biosynthesis